jgi:hypothetical protein
MQVVGGPMLRINTPNGVYGAAVSSVNLTNRWETYTYFVHLPLVHAKVILHSRRAESEHILLFGLSNVHTSKFKRSRLSKHQPCRKWRSRLVRCYSFCHELS